MRKCIPLVLIVLAVFFAFPAASGETKFPKEATFHFLMNSEPIGSNKSTFEEKDGIIIITSNTHVQNEEFDYRLSSRTEADAKTFQTLRYEYSGLQDGDTISGQFSLSEKEVAGYIVINEDRFSWSETTSTSGTYALQSYLMEHHILIVKAFLAGEQHYNREFELFYPSNTMLVPMRMNFESERELPLEDKAIVCKRLRMEMKGAQPVITFADPKENLPVYILFHSVRVEAFLESYFGKNPRSYYKWPEDQAWTPEG